VRDEGGADRREQDPCGPVMDPLTADPDAAATGVVTDETITVCPWRPHCASALFLIGISPRKFTVKLFAALVTALALVVSGCGGDEEEPASTGSTTVMTDTVGGDTETAARTETEQESPETETETAPAETGPEDQPGGAGDEEPARTLALFTAEDGRITPRAVRVPAFIAVQVQLRSGDGREYGLRFGDVTITAGGDLSSVSTTIDGLRPGEAIVGKPTGPGNQVRIEATAEPGP
jgi:hypothetical protein